MSDFVPLPPPPPPPGRGGRGQPRQWNDRQGRGRQGRGGRHGRNRGRGGRGRRQQRQGTQSEQRQSFNDVLDELGTRSEQSLCIAVEGCCHGELDAIYDRLVAYQNREGQKVDLLLCCGDFQSLRNTADYHSLAVPPKYRSLGSFCRYYSGERVAPILTIFVGGNHEASQPLQELYYGGWVAPNIYYLGAAGVVRIGGVRIGGISGIFKSHDYSMGRFERPPYDKSTLRSIYHVRNVDAFRLKCLSPQDRLEIMLSHDWPQGIEQHGNTADLIRRKPYFRNEIQRNELGSPPNYELLRALQPKWWFSAHLHVKFMATVRHSSQTQATPSYAGLVPSQIQQQQPADKTHSTKQAPDETATAQEAIVNEDMKKQPNTTQFHSLDSSTSSCNGPSLTDLMTQFLSLDKCLPRRHYLSIVHVPTDTPKTSVELEYDVEWLAILKKTHHLTIPERKRVRVPNNVLSVTEEEMAWVRDRLVQRQQQESKGKSPKRGVSDSALAIPQNFCCTVPPHNGPSLSRFPPPLGMMGNPQTDVMLELLDVEHVVTVPYTPPNSVDGSQLEGNTDLLITDDNEIDLDDEETDMDNSETIHRGALKSPAAEMDMGDEDEIILDDDEDVEEHSNLTTEKEEITVGTLPGSKRARVGDHEPAD